MHHCMICSSLTNHLWTLIFSTKLTRRGIDRCKCFIRALSPYISFRKEIHLLICTHFIISSWQGILPVPNYTKKETKAPLLSSVKQWKQQMLRLVILYFIWWPQLKPAGIRTTLKQDHRPSFSITILVDNLVQIFQLLKRMVRWHKPVITKNTKRWNKWLKWSQPNKK